MNDQVFLTSSSQPGVGVPLGVPEKLTEGTQNFKNYSKKLIWVQFLFWGYAEGYNLDLGARKYHKVENPWSRHYGTPPLPTQKGDTPSFSPNCTATDRTSLTIRTSSESPTGFDLSRKIDEIWISESDSESAGSILMTRSCWKIVTIVGAASLEDLKIKWKRRFSIWEKATDC